MGKTVIREEMFPEIVECYNREGRTAANKLMRNKYGISNTYFVMKRIKNSGRFLYNHETDSFSGVDSPSSENVFMNLEELCENQKSNINKNIMEVYNGRSEAMEKLVQELVSDRLLALSRYIVMDTSTRTIIVDQTSLTTDGYQIVTH